MKDEFQKENLNDFLLIYFDEILTKGFFSKYVEMIQKILKNSSKWNKLTLETPLSLQITSLNALSEFMKISKQITIENIELIENLIQKDDINTQLHQNLLSIIYQVVISYSEFEKYKIHLFTGLEDDRFEIKQHSLTLIGKLFLKRHLKYENQIFILSKCLLDSHESIQNLTKRILLIIFEKEETPRLFFNIFHCNSKEKDLNVLKITKIIYEDILSNETTKKNSSKFFVCGLLDNPNIITSKCLSFLPCQENDVHLIFENLSNSLFENEEILQNVILFVQKYKGKNSKVLQEIEKIKQKRKKRSFEGVQQDFSNHANKFQKSLEIITTKFNP